MIFANRAERLGRKLAASWAAGITAIRLGDGRWSATAECHDDTFRVSRLTTTDGRLTVAVANTKALAEDLGVSFRGPLDSGPAILTLPTLWYEGDGEAPELPPPDGWRELLTAEAERIGWRGPDTEVT